MSEVYELKKLNLCEEKLTMAGTRQNMLETHKSRKIDSCKEILTTMGAQGKMYPRHVSRENSTSIKRKSL